MIAFSISINLDMTIRFDTVDIENGLIIDKFPEWIVDTLTLLWKFSLMILGQEELVLFAPQKVGEPGNWLTINPQSSLDIGESVCDR